MRLLGAGLAAVALALSAPALAGAQSAGDEQYRDPFAGQQRDRQEAGSQDGEPNTAPGSSAPAPAPTTAPSPAPAAPGSEPVATTAGELPRTGSGAGWLTALGVVLVAAGARLRRTAAA